MRVPVEDWALPPGAVAHYAGTFKKACQECGQLTLGKAESKLNMWALPTQCTRYWSFFDPYRFVLKLCT